MKNPFRRQQPNEIDRQIAALNDIAATMREAAQTVALETSAPRLRQKLAELDPRLLDLILDQSRYDVLVGGNDLAAGSRRRAVEACRYAMRDIQIKAATQTWTDWGFGRALDVTANDPAADVVWQECWTAPRNRALFGQAVVHELSRDILRDGEVFFVGYASRQDGTTTWRTFDTLAITDIIHPKNDASINLWYIVTLGDKQVAIPDAFAFFAMRERYASVELPVGVADINTTATATENGGTFTVIVSALRNRDNEGRGWPEFYDALPWSNVYAQMLREYSAVFSAVAMYVDKIKADGGAQTVTDIVTALQSSLVSNTGYYDTNPRPAAGSTWVENQALDRTRMPLGTAAGDAQAGTGILALQLATGLGVKASDVGRVDMFQNKATADEAAKGPQQRWQRYQVFWASVWGDIVETTLRLVELFTPRRFTDYTARLSTSLPMDVETADLATAMDAVNKAAAAMTLDAATAMRANTAFLSLLLNDLGVEDVDDILNPPTNAEAAADNPPITLGESHTPVTVRHVCPLCGFGEAYSYAGHGALLVCAGCSKTYDPSCE